MQVTWERVAAVKKSSVLDYLPKEVMMTPLEASGEYSQMFCSDGKMSMDKVDTRTKKARHFRESHLNSSCILCLKKVAS